MDIKQDMSSLSSKLIAVTAIGVTALAVYLLVAPDNTERPVSQPTLSDKNAPVKPVVKAVNVTFPSVEKKQESVRNPFAVPAEYMTSKNKEEGNKEQAAQQTSLEAGSMLSGTGAQGSVAKFPQIIVTGVASSDDGQQLAVINDGKQSRAYRQGEWLGAYQVETIAADAVVFTGPAGDMVVPIVNNIKTGKSAAKERTGSENDSIHNMAQ